MNALKRAWEIAPGRFLKFIGKNRPADTPYDLLSAISSEDRRLLSIETAEAKVRQGGKEQF